MQTPKVTNQVTVFSVLTASFCSAVLILVYNVHIFSLFWQTRFDHDLDYTVFRHHTLIQQSWAEACSECWVWKLILDLVKGSLANLNSRSTYCFIWSSSTVFPCLHQWITIHWWSCFCVVKCSGKGLEILISQQMSERLKRKKNDF